VESSARPKNIRRLKFEYYSVADGAAVIKFGGGVRRRLRDRAASRTDCNFQVTLSLTPKVKVNFEI